MGTVRLGRWWVSGGLTSTQNPPEPIRTTNNRFIKDITFFTKDIRCLGLCGGSKEAETKDIRCFTKDISFFTKEIRCFGRCGGSGEAETGRWGPQTHQEPPRTHQEPPRPTKNHQEPPRTTKNRFTKDKGHFTKDIRCYLRISSLRISAFLPPPLEILRECQICFQKCVSEAGFCVACGAAVALSPTVLQNRKVLRVQAKKKVFCSTIPQNAIKFRRQRRISFSKKKREKYALDLGFAWGANCKVLI